MARLLKNVYIKASSHSKFCCFATKANPYVEVLKTLKSWEQDLQNKSKHFLNDSENDTLKDQIFSRQSVSLNENGLKNVCNKSIHLKGDTKNSEVGIKSEESICDDTFFSDKAFSSENSDMLEKFISVEQGSETKSKNLFPKREIIKNSNDEQLSSKFKLTNQRQNVKGLTNTFSRPEGTETIRQPKDSKGRTINKSLSDNELQVKKKSKKAKAKTSNLLGNDSKSLNKSTDDFRSKENVKMVSSAKSKVAENESISKKFSKDKVKSKNQLSVNKDDLKKKVKQDMANQSLKSLMESYINAKEIHKAHRIFEYLNLDKKKKEYVDVNLYNLMLSGWARQGKLDKVKQLFCQMNNDNITPNLQSFASYLEAISRCKCVDVAEIPKVVNEMKVQGFSPLQLLQKCVFVADQREKVIETLGFVERDLNVPLYVPEKAYSCKLLEKLNDKNYEKEGSHFNFCFKSEDISKLAFTQMETERVSTIKIKSVDNVAELSDKIINSREYLKECEKMWRTRLTKIINNFKSPKKPNQGVLGSSPNQSIYPYLAVIDTDILVNLLLQEVRVLGETAEFYSPNVKVLYRELGGKVMRLYFMALSKQNKITDKVHFIYEKYLHYLLDPDLYAKYSPREYWEFLKSEYCEGPTIDVPNANWPYSLLVFIGSILYNVLRSNICFNPNRIVNRKSVGDFMYPAFHIVYENFDIRLNRQIRTHDMFSKLYRDAKLDYLEFDVNIVPMLSPPRPWIKSSSGGMLITKVPFIRFPDHARSQTSFYTNVPAHQLNPCFDSLNNLSLCPWIINKPLLDIVIKIFQDGGSEELDIPLNPANFSLKATSADDLDENGNISYKRKMEYEKKKCEMTSLWFDCLYKLSIANHFREKVFWFPHNLDFRGRVYPTPPHFNHLGSDMSRSILLFADGKPLGEKGLDWLKIHLINLTGFKKRAPHLERLKYANEMLPEILDSADNPFGGNKWWLNSDKPLQTLACCMEVANAVRHPNPKEYISHFPVHQDGSCNGLQHYAALGRDELGAIEVNLHPSNKPQDVYSGVAALVEKEREKDAMEGLEIAKALKGFVTRKVVKQTVMTFVYGVTAYGARLQVLKQLKDIPDFPEKYHHTASTYLMKKIFLSIKEMFTATKKIQDWFTDCAEEITRVTGDSVEWVTPIGLPVVQPYYQETNVRSSKFCISKASQENISHYVSHFEPYQSPNVRKQKNAFAPNFIHSLDSTHMMLTSLYCHRKGVTFVSVHDCYWTHASTVEIMNKICREQFVSLHSEPILENLSQFFVQKYVNTTEMDTVSNQKQVKAKSNLQNVLSAVPDKGTFNLEQVLNSEYFFS